MSDFLIGVTDPNAGRSFSKKDWHKLEAGDNLFRILPPVHSLAKAGKYYQYYAVHGGFKNQAGRQMKFQCIEEKDFKTKLITKRCPVCDMVSEKKKNYDQLKAAMEAGNTQVTKEKLKAFHDAYIYPYQADKKNYVNAVDASGKIGILPVSYRVFSPLSDLIKKRAAAGDDITGMSGAFVQITKTQRFKGDSQTTYSVQLAAVQDGDVLKIRRHQLTPDFINEMKTKTADLGDLYRSISAEDMAALVAADETGRAAIIERLFPKFEKAQEVNETDALLSQTIPGTTATAIGRAELSPVGLTVSAPDVSSILAGLPEAAPAQSSAPVQSSAPAAQNTGIDLGQLLSMPVAKAAPAPTATPSTPAPSTEMSNDEFTRMLQGLK